MKFVQTRHNYRIYELDQKECKQFYRSYPTFVCWEEKPHTVNRDIGNMSLTENEAASLQEMLDWCDEYQ